jgi:spermidine synthase
MTRPIALVLTLLTGFSGLVYEVTWQRYLAILLGSHAEARASVLAIFLGGLAVGYEIFGRVTRRRVAPARVSSRPPQLLRLYAWVEISIGLYALAFPTLFDLRTGPSHLLGGLSGRVSLVHPEV